MPSVIHTEVQEASVLPSLICCASERSMVFNATDFFWMATRAGWQSLVSRSSALALSALSVDADSLATSLQLPAISSRMLVEMASSSTFLSGAAWMVRAMFLSISAKAASRAAPAARLPSSLVEAAFQ